MSLLPRFRPRNVGLNPVNLPNKKYFNYPVTYHFNLEKRHFSYQSIVQKQAEIFKTVSESTPVEYTQKFLLAVHDTTGLPWWASIVCATVILRGCITVPLGIYQNHMMARLENVKIEMDEIAKELKKETSVAVRMYKWDEKTARFMFRRSIRKQWIKLIERDNCHPLKTTILFWFQIPLWVSFSFSLRNLVYMLPEQNLDAKLTFVELSVGGFGWIPNLTEIDHSLVLPITFGLINLAIVEIQALCKVKPPSKLQIYITNLFRGVSILMVPIAASVPSCLVLYWTTSSSLGLIQNLIMMSPRVKRSLKIPETPSELEQPYQYLLVRIKDRVKSLLGLFKIS